MKKSLIWRFSIIALVLAGWGFSLFPLKDRPFTQVLRQEAQEQMQGRADRGELTGQLLTDNLAALDEIIAEAKKRATDRTAASCVLIDAAERQIDLRDYFPVPDKPKADNEAVLAFLASTHGAAAEGEGLFAVLEKAAQNSDVALEKIIASGRQALASPPPSIERMIIAGAEAREVPLYTFLGLYKKPHASNKEIAAYVRRRARGKLRLGLDLRGGTEFVIAFDPEKATDYPAEELRDQIIEIIRNRIDQMGVLEPEIKGVGASTISIKVPSVDPGEVEPYRKLIKASAKLEFRMVHDNSAAFASGAEEPPRDYERMLLKSSRPDREDEVVWVKLRAERVTGEHLSGAYPDMDEFGNYRIAFQFDNRGAKLFYDLTSANVEKRMGIVLDGTLYSAPVIRSAISGSGVIEGGFTGEEAKQLSVVMRSGNLPVDIDIQGEFSTNPTLGSDTVKSGITAGFWGLAIVAAFLLVYYMQSGLIALVALTANVLLVLGTMPILDATITLPGIAGMILTIGMAVDANVLIFERMREELGVGKSVATAVKNGYSKALSTIIDANLTTFFVALILMKFGSGPIRGFAVTLSIGILASMFTALFMTRTIFDLLVHTDVIKKLPMRSLLKPTEWRFLDARSLAALLSGFLIIGSLVAFGVRRNNALSVDFTGGAAITYTYKDKVPAAKIGQHLTEVGYPGARATYKSSAVEETQLLEIVLPQDLPRDGNPAGELERQLNGKFGAGNFTQGTANAIGGLVGKRFKIQACWSMFWALIVIVVYISFRFEFGYALGAVAALAHDVIIGAGIFLMANFGDRQISLTVIAGLLTIIGYSLNDTIVVFDRVRENLELHKNSKFFDLLNISLNQTLSRTLLTSLTTLFVVVTLYLFGGGAINDFALIMMLGIIVGTYSSIFVATPVLILWHRRQEAKTAPASA